MTTMSLDQIHASIRESVRAEMAQNAPVQAEPKPLNPVATQDINDALASEDGIKAIQSLFDAGKLTWPEVKTVEQAQDKPKPDSAEMGMNPVMDAVRSLDRTGGGVPWGSALVGGGLGFVLSEIINGIPQTAPSQVPGEINFTSVAVKLGAAWGMSSFTSPYIGRTGAMIGTGVILVDLLRDFSVVDDFVNWIVDKVSGFFGGLSSGNRFQIRQQQNYHQPALNAPQNQFIPGLGDFGANKFDYVFDPR